MHKTARGKRLFDMWKERATRADHMTRQLAYRIDLDDNLLVEWIVKLNAEAAVLRTAYEMAEEARTEVSK